MNHKSQDKMSEIDEHIVKRFDIKKRLGKGAYGIVWKALDKKTGETVAIKKIFDAFRNQTDSQRTFREIMFLQSFRNHPNIIQLHSVHRAANNRDIYLGFEYMDTDLHMVIKRGNILRDCHKRFIMYQLLNATKYIHSGNVIHRDQKPSNVLLDQNCRCKVADFGLARSLAQIGTDGSGSESDSDPTLTDYVATRWYRAPEILIASKRYTKGIDMWSLGCILGEMLAGKPLFPGTSTVNQIEKIMATIPPPTAEDINTVCTGMGVSMIQNSLTCSRISFLKFFGNNYSNDALDLITKLLVFNPNKRLTAEQAIEHEYVAQYRDKSIEMSLNKNIVPPLNDDIRLSVDDYRNKLYEYMSHHRISKPFTRNVKKTSFKPCEVQKPNVIKIRTSPTVTRGTVAEKSYKVSLVKEQAYKVPVAKAKATCIQSEVKFQYTDSRPKVSTVSVTTASRIPTAIRNNFVFQELPKKNSSQHRNSLGDFRTVGVKYSSLSLIADKNKIKGIANIKSNPIYNTTFNSYNQNRGVITASALRELKSGVR